MSEIPRKADYSGKQALGRAREALKIGAYAVALRALDVASTLPETRDEANGLAFDALRQIRICRLLIRRFYATLGWPEAAYQGFAGTVEPTLTEAEVERRLRDLTGLNPGDPSRTDRALTLYADKLAQGQTNILTLGDSDGLNKASVTRVQYLLARWTGDQTCLNLLRRTLPNIWPSQSLQQLMGWAAWEKGDRANAITHFHLATLCPEDNWFEIGNAIDKRFMDLGQFKGFRIIYATGRFLAYEDDDMTFVTLELGNPSVIRHKIPVGVRRRLRSLLPERLVSWLRWIIFHSFLRDLVFLSTQNAAYLESAEFPEILATIERRAAPKG